MEDKHEILGSCDVVGCTQISCCGGIYWSERGFWKLCQNHVPANKNDEFPLMKNDAIEREVLRGDKPFPKWGCM